MSHKCRPTISSFLLCYPSLLVWSHTLSFHPLILSCASYSDWICFVCFELLGSVGSFWIISHGTQIHTQTHVKLYANTTRYVGSTQRKLIRTQPATHHIPTQNKYECLFIHYDYILQTTHTHIKCWSSLFSFSALSILFIRRIFSEFFFVRFALDRGVEMNGKLLYVLWECLYLSACTLTLAIHMCFVVCVCVWGGGYKGQNKNIHTI